MRGLVVDLFAGGGGASLGLAVALGRKVDIAINHDPVALAVHKANHPETRHLETDIWEVKPRDATQGRPVDVLWASPDCTHFSVAKGAVPRRQNIRSLAWVVVRWARDVRPRLIFLENVAEFRSWGPLGKDGRPLKRRAGETFRKWTRHLRRLGYAIDFRVLDASEYGAPTRRRRLFLVARCDGRAITWPEPTHGPGRAPFHTAAECIDWSLACPSIFERKRPLADKTMWRIAQGIRRFVLETAQPFIVKVNHGKLDARGESLGEPLTTVVAQRRGHALVTPHLTKFQDHSPGQDAREPLHTILAGAPRFGVVAPHLVEMNHSNKPRQLDLPLGVITTQGNRHNLVAPTLIQTGFGEDTKRNGGRGQAARVPGLHKPLGAICAGGGKRALVAAFLAKHFGGVVGHGVERPVGTITARDHHSVAAATLLRFNHDDHGVDVRQPLPTTTAGSRHIAEVRAFLTVYYGTDGPNGQALDDPMRVVRAKHCLGLVTVAGVDYQIADIGMRMLEPHELLRAQFGSFAGQYDLSAAKTKTAKVRLIGNSVCPEQALAVVRANRPSAAERAA